MNRVKLGDVAFERKETCKVGKEQYPIVGLEHLIPDQITLTEWSDDPKTTFTKFFHKGDVLFGRRAYLRKAVIAPFDGICSGDITVISAMGGKIAPELLPHIIQNEAFFDFAVGKSDGSLSPRVKWDKLEKYEFNLPSLDEQQKLAEILWSMVETKEAYSDLLQITDELVKSQFIEMFGEAKKYPLKELSEVAEIIAGGDKPIDNSDVKTDEYCFPVYANGVENEGLQCYVKKYRVDREAVTISARGTIGATFLRQPFFTPVVRLITVIPGRQIDATYLKYAIDYVRVSGNGSSQQQLTVPNVCKIRIPMPEIEQQKEYTTFVNQSGKSKYALQETIDALNRTYKKIIAENLG